MPFVSRPKPFRSSSSASPKLAAMGRGNKMQRDRKRREKDLEDREKRWVEVNYKEWDDARAGSQRPTPTAPGNTAVQWYELQTKILQEVRAKKHERQGAGASSSKDEAPDAAGVVHPAAEGAEPDRTLDMEEATEVWKQLCNTVFPKRASFEPMQYVSVVAGRPVVVPRVANESPALAPNPLRNIPSIMRLELMASFPRLRPNQPPHACQVLCQVFLYMFPSVFCGCSHISMSF